jgi:FKBP-type peptidyl-prolyl cis-trans isomerase FkpA
VKEILMPRVVLMMLSLLVCVTACKPPPPPPAPVAPAVPVTELQKTDLVGGAGDAIASGSVAVVHYTGWFYDPVAKDHKGKQFDSSRERGEPLRFAVGFGQVIRGWDEGIVGMKVGGQRRLIVPAAFAYGDAGAGGVIPPGSALVFDVELLSIQAASPRSTGSAATP